MTQVVSHTDPMTWLEVVLRLAVALACGALIGIERQYRQHSAGLRTSALVATGSALFVLAAALGAGIVLLANVLLRPLARIVNRQSQVSGETGETPVHYVVRAVCLSQQEIHIRSLLLQGVSENDLLLLALSSADKPDPTRVEVRADLQADGRKDALLEHVVAHLSLEASVSAVRWEVVSSEAEEDGTALTALAPRANPPEAGASI
jgi:uncharacterized membrane protein YhiD involved in acid resistance